MAGLIVENVSSRAEVTHFPSLALARPIVPTPRTFAKLFHAKGNLEWRLELHACSPSYCAWYCLSPTHMWRPVGISISPRVGTSMFACVEIEGTVSDRTCRSNTGRLDVRRRNERVMPACDGVPMGWERRLERRLVGELASLARINCHRQTGDTPRPG